MELKRRMSKINQWRINGELVESYVLRAKLPPGGGIVMEIIGGDSFRFIIEHCGKWEFWALRFPRESLYFRLPTAFGGLSFPLKY